MNWIYLVLAGVVAWGLTGVLRRYAINRSILDVPNSRSSHSVPTPRGGGVAIALTFLIGLLVLWLMNLVTLPFFLAFVGSGAVVALIGFADDHADVAAYWRLLAHFIAAAWGLYWLGGLPALHILGFELTLGWIGYFIAVMYLVWLLNLYNFMDGIDGIAGIEAITVCFGGLVLFLLGGFGSASEQLPVILLITTSVGFVLWNFPTAKIFMGDAGSGFVGLLLGLFSVAAGHVDQSLFWGWLILLGAFIVDATLTLIRRVIDGKAFYQAHRSHAYQYAARRLGGHKPVSLAFGAINLLWLLPVALTVVLGFIDGMGGVIIAYAPLIALALRFKAGDEIGQEV